MSARGNWYVKGFADVSFGTHFRVDSTYFVVATHSEVTP